MKRLFDIVFSIIGLLISFPVILIVMLLIWIEDLHSPFYIANRIGKGGRAFQMIKFRSMIVGADKCGVDSTATDDIRITWIGRIIRRYKLDEITQLINVMCGDMSFVGPRPNVKRDVDLYSEEEYYLLSVRPGITDFASIVFSDEGEILEGSDNPDLKYNQLIRPWKSRLGLFYIKKRNFLMDLKIIWITIIALLSKPMALLMVQNILERLDADSELINIVKRNKPLYPFPPPGMKDVQKDRVTITS